MQNLHSHDWQHAAKLGARSSTEVLEFLIRNLEQRSPLSDGEKAALRALPWSTVSFAAGEELAKMGDRPSESHLLISGFVARVRFVDQGGRQILALHVPGDFTDLQSFLLKQMDHTVTAMSAGQIAAVAHKDLAKLCDAHPRLARILWRSSLVDAAIHREWLLGLGRQNATQRTAHIMLELCFRLAKVGLCKDGQFELPLSQTDLSDMVGLSPVHVNRTLQELRSRNLISWKGRKVAVLDWDELAKVAEFDPTYLHFDRTEVE
jgi:CRP-like cAMP-binding protein